MRADAVTSTYKNNNTIKRRRNKRKEMFKKFFDDIIDKMDVNAASNCFMIIKD